MEKQQISNRVDFTWFIGAGISIILTVIAIITYSDSGIPLIFPIVCLGSYAGVLIRGVIDPDSWGKNSRMRRFSAAAGLFSCFAIIFTELLLLLFFNSDRPEPSAGKVILIAGGVLLLLFLILYSFWLRKVTY
jgi:heme/copper-type cytochrome/quinol oxidase subunit 4